MYIKHKIRINLSEFSKFLALFVPGGRSSRQHREVGDEHAAAAARFHDSARRKQREIDELEKKMNRKTIWKMKTIDHNSYKFKYANDLVINKQLQFRLNAFEKQENHSFTK